MSNEASSKSSTGEESAFKIIHMVVGRTSASLAVDWKLPPVLSIETSLSGSSEHGSCLSQSKKQEEPERDFKQEGIWTFVTSYNFSCIIFIRSEASPHSGEGDFTRAWISGCGNTGPCQKLSNALQYISCAFISQNHQHSPEKEKKVLYLFINLLIQKLFILFLL